MLSALALALSACANDAPTAAPTTVPYGDPLAISTTTTPPAPASPVRGAIADQDRVFLDELQSRHPDWENYFTAQPRGQLFQLGELTCTKMRTDKLTTLQKLMDSMGLNRATYLMHTASMAYCPDQLSGIN